ncbi:N-acyl homoserine lactonase family protein [Halotalea alkalilenta]|uniref:AttM/AiiB n=1 Tax=Halotalea alkalilenta TaxID=376489 RepID=A0A172YF55_9GAMM|nr:N-acyl homoserine lactonase family protein [Halotalea alkalilenta]ANF57595.1 AttM/AiiB [Halotalea alkalilenta]
MNEPGNIERIYILDGGIAEVDDASIYSPGVNVGVPMRLSCNAYLIRHRSGWLLWDTGTQDDLVAEPDGRIMAHGIRAKVHKTIASQLADIGVRPDEIGTLVISHAHYDHVGNCRLFRKAKWIVQKAEYEAMFGPAPDRFGYLPELYSMLDDNPTELVEGDHDIFGDGTVRMIATPGHTPGHCSLLVRLPKTGPVLLSGDIAHDCGNYRCRCVPSFNVDSFATVASMEKVDALLRAEGAKLWINHDIAQSATLAHAPSWIE